MLGRGNVEGRCGKKVREVSMTLWLDSKLQVVYWSSHGDCKSELWITGVNGRGLRENIVKNGVE